MVGPSKIAPFEEDDEEPRPSPLTQRRDPPKDSGQSISRSSITGSIGSPIEVDSTPNTDDDASGHSGEGDTVSVTSNVWKFDKENGRTYHGYKSGVYFYPNDATEAERLDYQYQVIQEALQHKLHFAPLNRSITHNILDIGTGTGVWAIEMGDLYPNATVEATDLSPIQPDAVPENVQFIIDDAAEEDWAVPESHYDFIHTRIMMGSFHDFKEIIRRGFRYTKPGGWMESQDVMHPPFSDDGTMPPDWPFREWSMYIEDAAKEAGRPLRIANKMKRWYIEAGFVDVQEKVVKLPINTWPRDKNLKVLGQWWAENLLSGLQGFSLALLSRVFSWSKDEIEVYLVNVRKSIVDRRVHAYHKFYTVWGRKPMKGEVVIPPEEQLRILREQHQQRQQAIARGEASGSANTMESQELMAEPVTEPEALSGKHSLKREAETEEMDEDLGPRKRSATIEEQFRSERGSMGLASGDQNPQTALPLVLESPEYGEQSGAGVDAAALRHSESTGYSQKLESIGNEQSTAGAMGSIDQEGLPTQGSGARKHSRSTSTPKLE